MARDHGFAEYLNKLNLTSKYVQSTLENVLTNRAQYLTNVRRIKSLMLDSVMPALDKTAWFIDKSLTKGIPNKRHFYKKGQYLPYSLAYNVDVIAVWSLFILFLTQVVI